MRALVLFATIVSLACAKDSPASKVDVQRAWARPADAGGLTAVYLVLVNRESAPITLSGESSLMAESVSLHETMKMGDMVHMMALNTPQVIAAGDSLVLHEGEKHLMLTKIKQRLSPGDSVPITLTLSDGRALQVKAEIRAP